MRNIIHARDRNKAIPRVILVTLLLLPGFGCSSGQEPPRREQTNPQAEPSNLAARPLRVRAPAVAGLFYPADEPMLSSTIDALLESAPVHYIPRLRGLVCPHAGYSYSGQTAANAYKTLAGRAVQTVIILGPSHYAAFPGASVSRQEAYQTPLGTVPISAKAQQLVQGRPFVFEPQCLVQRPSWWRQASKPAPAAGEDTPETWEHSIEVQVPFLQKVLKNFQILPVILGDADPEQVAKGLAEKIDDQTVVVASSDLSHFHSYDDAKGLDNRCVKAICDLNLEAMRTQEACGKSPILTLMHLARQKGWKTRLLDYRNSGDVSAEKDRVVGYTAIAFYAPVPENYLEPERRLLLDLARKALSSAAQNSSLSEINTQDAPPKLLAKKACFVTLTKQGSLRGCIGHILPQEPLYQAVLDNAQSAARRDPRFRPVQPDELKQIKIEVSVLTEPQPLRFTSPEDLLNKLQPYEDGVLLQMGSRGATFLPQVWAQIPSKVDFLNQLSQKAGCDPSAWRGKETSVSIYHVESFEELE